MYNEDGQIALVRHEMQAHRDPRIYVPSLTASVVPEIPSQPPPPPPPGRKLDAGGLPPRGPFDSVDVLSWFLALTFAPNDPRELCFDRGYPADEIANELNYIAGCVIHLSDSSFSS